MPDYKQLYFKLAASVADAVELLIKAQLEAEDAYIEAGQAPPIQFIPQSQEDNKHQQ